MVEILLCTIGTYMGVTGLILVNLFIALLTATFNSIHDASKAQLLLQRAIECLGIERKMSERKRRKHLNYLKNPSIGKINFLTKFVSKNSHGKKIDKIEKIIQDVDSKTMNLEKNFDVSLIVSKILFHFHVFMCDKNFFIGVKGA